ncbi:MAG TPA: rRNA maturation RNase YbeY [Stellaceae bacterium]|nr:rRNA maturation RNase YbeY [Stellaceae bacterium]
MTRPFAAADVILRRDGWSNACPEVRRLVRAAARRAVARGMADRGWPPPARLEVAILLADDSELARLNRRFRGKPGPTNVLSFPASAPGAATAPGTPLVLGDVALALETVVREAAEQQKPLPDHLAHLVVHGVLHLIGYDHHSAADAARMESLEKSILAELGVPDPYRDTMYLVQPEPNP